MANMQTSYLQLKLKNSLRAASLALTNCAKRIRKYEQAGIDAFALEPVIEEQIKNEVTDILLKDSQNTGHPVAEDHSPFLKYFSNKGK